MKKFILTTVLLVAGIAFAKPVQYQAGTEKFNGEFLASSKKNAPGIVVIHNWMGSSAETLKQATRFQKLGYNVFVADIYGAGIRPANPKEAGELATKYKSNRSLFRERIHLALNEITKMPSVDKNKLAVVGYCFGGTGALEAARAGENLKAVISFHGGLDSPAPNDGAQIKAKVLALHGAIDPYVKAEDLTAFEAEMQKHKIDYELLKYSGTVHSFTEEAAGADITKGAAYNAQSDQRSFARAKEFLSEAFQ